MATERDRKTIDGARVVGFAAIALFMISAVLYGLFTGQAIPAKARRVSAVDDATVFWLTLAVQSVLGFGAGLLAWRGFEDLRRR